MAEKDTVFSGKIKQKGIFNFKDFYAFAYDWLNGEGYSVTEKTYTEEISSDSKSIEIEWQAKKKVSDYFKFVIKVGWIVGSLRDQEIIKEGKKIKTNSGSVSIKVSGILIKDYESRWEENPFWKFLRGIYERYIIRSRIDDYEGKLSEEADEFVAQCKAYLEIEAKR